jgi:hypothetical protein
MKSLARFLLLRLRVHVHDGKVTAPPYSPEYLYLVQQDKRLALSRLIGHLGWKTLPLWPLLVLAIAVRWLDLAMSTSVIRSLVNERDLLRQANDSAREDRA